ncbi:MAG: hypothetical protein LBD46_04745 [Endomicrobium sp.]|nr:hypothetical protein [Endomicrobium sp.]
MEDKIDRRKTSWGKELWRTLIVAIIAVAVSYLMNWSLYEFKINQAHAAIQIMNTKDNEQDSRIIKIETKVDSIDKTLDKNESTLNRVSENITEILRYLRK